MNDKFLRLLLYVALCFSVSGCARDLSSVTYTSDSTLSLTMEGTVLSVRPITVKNNDTLSGNTGGVLAGGAMGAATGANIGGGNGKVAAVVGGAIAGAVIGSVVEGQLSKSEGFEYIIKVDTSKLKSDYYEGSAAMRDAISSATTNGLVTIVQGKDVVINKGQKVYVIFSEKRTRVIPAT